MTTQNVTLRIPVDLLNRMPPPRQNPHGDEYSRTDFILDAIKEKLDREN